MAPDPARLAGRRERLARARSMPVREIVVPAVATACVAGPVLSSDLGADPSQQNDCGVASPLGIPGGGKRLFHRLYSPSSVEE